MQTVSRRRPATLLLSLLSAVFALSALLVNPHGAAAARGPVGVSLSNNTLALSPSNQTATVVPGHAYIYDYTVTNTSAQPQKVHFEVKNPAGWNIVGAVQDKEVSAFGTTHVKIEVRVPNTLPTATGSNMLTLGVITPSAPATGSAISYLTLQWGTPVLKLQ